jgi:hypothetical protein
MHSLKPRDENATMISYGSEEVSCSTVPVEIRFDRNGYPIEPKSELSSRVAELQSSVYDSQRKLKSDKAILRIGIALDKFIRDFPGKITTRTTVADLTALLLEF